MSGELKEIAAGKIAEFLEEHQERRAQLESLEDELEPYRLTENERKRARNRVGYPDDSLIQR